MAGLKGHQAAPFIDKANPEDAPVYLENFGIPDQIAMHSSREVCRKGWMLRSIAAPIIKAQCPGNQEFGIRIPASKCRRGVYRPTGGGDRAGNQMHRAMGMALFSFVVRKRGGLNLQKDRFWDFYTIFYILTVPFSSILFDIPFFSG
jgi:hypothetical protein